MASTDVLIDCLLTGGMNEKADGRLALVPTLIENGRYRKTGSISTRVGSVAIAPYATRFNASVAPSSAPPTAQLLTTRVDELVRVGSGELDTVTQATAAGSQDSVFRGNVPSCVMRKSGRIGGTLNAGDSAVTTPHTGPFSGRKLVATAYLIYSTSAALSIYVDVLDQTAGTVLAQRMLVASGSGTIGATVKVCDAGDVFIVVYVESTSVKFKVIDLVVGLTLSSATTAGSCSSVTEHLDAVGQRGVSGGFGADPWSLYTVAVSNALADYKVMYNDSGGGTATSSATLTLVKAVAISASPTNGDPYFHVMAVDVAGGTTTVYGRRYTAGGATAAAAAFSIKAYTASPTNVQAAIGRLSTTMRVYAWSDDSTRTLFWDKRNDAGVAQFATTTRQIGVGTASATHSPVALASKPFLVGSKMYAGVTTVQFSSDTTANLGTVCLLDLYAESDSATIVTGRFEACELPQQAYRADSAYNVPRVMDLGSSVYGFNVCTSDVETIGATGQRNDIHVALADFAWIPTAGGVANGSLCLAGGMPHDYDGYSAVESSFLQTPVISTPSQSTSGSLTLLKTYQYCSHYEQEDANGNVHRGPISAVKTVTLTGSNSNTAMTLSCLHATNKKPMVSGAAVGPVYIVLLRTLADASTFYRVGRYPSTINGAAVSVTDTIDDASLQTRPLRYTDAGVLESQAPPSAGFRFRSQDRMFLLKTDDGSVWFSDTIVPGEAPRYNIDWTIPPPREGTYECGAQLDAYTVFFTTDAIDVIYGDGPDSAGSGSFSLRQRVASSLGCIDGRSIVSTEHGVFFQSRDGLCLLTRSLQVRRIGKAVEESSGATQATPYGIVAAVNVPEQAEVRFPVDVTGIQRAIVFDLEHGADLQDAEDLRQVWERYAWTDPVGGTPKIVSACTWNNRYTWINSAGRVYQDDPTTYLDTAAGYTSVFVPVDIDCAPIRPTNVQGWARIRRVSLLGDKKTRHDLTVRLYPDYEATPETFPLTAAQLDAMDMEQIQFTPNRQKVQALRVRITTATPTGGTLTTGEGLRLQGVTLRIAPKAGLRKRPNSALAA